MPPARLGDPEALPGRDDDQPDADPQPGKHINQAVDAEEVEAPSDEFTDPGLGHAKQLGRLGLLQAAGIKRPLDLDEEVRPNSEMFGLLLRKPQILENVARRSSCLEFHVPPSPHIHRRVRCAPDGVANLPGILVDSPLVRRRKTDRSRNFVGCRCLGEGLKAPNRLDFAARLSICCLVILRSREGKVLSQQRGPGGQAAGGGS